MVALTAMTASAAPTADSLSVAATYASGVHAFNAGNLSRSYEDFTSVIEAGSGDPRAWYFRGLALLGQGRTDEAEADFTEGATREAAGRGAWPVSRSLERVQGPQRLQLERHRVQARLAALQQRRVDEKRRYSQIEEAQPEVLRRRRPADRTRTSDADPFEPRKVAPAAEAPAAELMPPQEPAPAPAPAPAAEAPEPEPAPAEKPAAPNDDPFAPAPAPPAPEPL